MNDFLKKLKEWLPMIIFIGAFAFALSARWGLPPRVDKLEIEMQEQKIKSAQVESILPTMASDLKDIKNFIYNLKK